LHVDSLKARRVGVKKYRQALFENSQKKTLQMFGGTAISPSRVKGLTGNSRKRD